MQVTTGIGSAAVTGADGIVWDEKFTYNDCYYLADFLAMALEGKFYGVATPHAAAVERVRNMFYALINDSDACIVHCATTTGATQHEHRHHHHAAVQRRHG
jgi:hypothetical protein